jgi:hypothetical protein
MTVLDCYLHTRQAAPFDREQGGAGSYGSAFGTAGAAPYRRVNATSASTASAAPIYWLEGWGFESPLGHSGLPTELPVSYRQNCFGDRFLLCLEGLTLVLAAARGLFTGQPQPASHLMPGQVRER